jgi:ribosome-binding protein aMBF1 (putative translation factor)
VLFYNINIKKGTLLRFFMAECYRCGISDERERLFDAVSNQGVVKICKSCADEEGLPLMQPADLNKPEKNKTVYERLSRMANLNPEEHKRKLIEMERQKDIRFGRSKRPEVTVKSPSESNFERNKPKARTDLIDNFHWVIMRARRSKKLTQKQLADNIGEQESTIKSAEEGTIFDNNETFLRKIESYLNIKLRKVDVSYSSDGSKFVKAGDDSARREIKERFEKDAKFDAETTETLTIADLQEIKKKKESEGKGFFSFLKRKKKDESKPEENDEKMSDEEVEDILFKE